MHHALLNLVSSYALCGESDGKVALHYSTRSSRLPLFKTWDDCVHWPSQDAESKCERAIGRLTRIVTLLLLNVTAISCPVSLKAQNSSREDDMVAEAAN